LKDSIRAPGDERTSRLPKLDVPKNFVRRKGWDRELDVRFLPAADSRRQAVGCYALCATRSSGTLPRLFAIQFLSWSAMFCMWTYGLPVIAGMLEKGVEAAVLNVPST
jgi:hypothetical protein